MRSPAKLKNEGLAGKILLTGEVNNPGFDSGQGSGPKYMLLTRSLTSLNFDFNTCKVGQQDGSILFLLQGCSKL